jgi:tight adherence protein C
VNVMNASHLGSLALTLGAVGVLLLAVLVLLRVFLSMRSKQTLEDALEQRTAARTAANARAAGQVAKTGSEESAAPVSVRARFTRVFDMLSQQGARLLETNLGKQIVTEEERHLLDQCGYSDLRTRSIFLSMRIICLLLLPFITLVVIKLTGGSKHTWIIVAVSAVFGMMLPKFYIQRRASNRRRAVIDEMPLMVDMMRLLQGVGLSLDQSMHVVTNDFRRMLPVLSYEFGIAQRQYVTGRSREQSLLRLTNSFDNEDLRAVVRLLIQVDKHGGAVQEPFKQFGDRMREGRRALLRERIGKLTVKMTAVMILTLLPALFIVTAGPGVMGVMHAFSQTQNHE